MEILDISEDNIDALLARAGVLIVDAWAPWCGPCRQFAPVFEKAAADHSEHTFAKIDTEANKDLAAELEIKHIPTLLVYRDGILLYRKAGSPAAEVLENLITQIEAVDMDMVRADVEAEKKKAAQDLTPKAE